MGYLKGFSGILGDFSGIFRGIIEGLSRNFLDGF